MSFVETETIEISDRQLESCLDTIAFREAVSRMGSGLDDEQVVIAALQNARSAKPKKAIGDACFTELSTLEINALVRMFTYDVIDTTKPEQWFTLMQAIRAANRIAAVKCTYQTTRNIYPDTLIEAVAEMLDVFIRLVDSRVRYSALPLEDANKQRLRHMSLCMDLLCGRGVCWLWFCEMMFLQACVVNKIDIKSEYARRAMDAYVLEQKTLGSSLGNEDAAKVMSWSTLKGAYEYNDLCKRYKGAEFPPLNSFSCEGKEEFVNRLISLAEHEKGADITGIFDVFNISAFTCTTALDTASKEKYRQLFIGMRELYESGKLTPEEMGLGVVPIVG